MKKTKIFFKRKQTKIKNKLKFKLNIFSFDTNRRSKTTHQNQKNQMGGARFNYMPLIKKNILNLHRGK